MGYSSGLTVALAFSAASLGGGIAWNEASAGYFHGDDIMQRVAICQKEGNGCNTTHAFLNACAIEKLEQRSTHRLISGLLILTGGPALLGFGAIAIGQTMGRRKQNPEKPSP